MQNLVRSAGNNVCTQPKIDVRFGDLHIPQDLIFIDSNVREVVSRAIGLSEEQAVYQLFDYVCREIAYPGGINGSFNDLHVMEAYPYADIPFLGYLFQVSKSQREYFQFPFETIAWEVGDCDDTAILLCALLRAYGISPSRVVVAIGEIPPGGHAWVELDGNILETTLTEAPEPPYSIDGDYRKLWAFNDAVVNGEIALVEKVCNRAKGQWIGQRWQRGVKL